MTDEIKTTTSSTTSGRCIVLCDAFGDRHATTLESTETLLDEVYDFARDLGIDDGEEIDYGTADVADPCEARMAYTTVNWIDSFIFSDGEDSMSDVELRRYERQQRGIC